MKLDPWKTALGALASASLLERLPGLDKKTDRWVRSLLGLPGRDARDGYVPYCEDGRVWRGDQVYPLASLPADPLTGRFGRDGAYWIENLRWGFVDHPDGTHEGRFRRTLVDTSKATAARSLLYRFHPHEYAGHVALLIEFAEGGVLDPETGASSQGLVLSVEAKLEEGQTYGYLPGLLGPLVPGLPRYPLVWVLSTYEDYQERIFGHCKRRELERYPLDLTPEQVRELATRGLETALADHRDQSYQLSRHSCVTEHLDLLDEVLEPGRRVPRRFLGGWFVDPRASVPAKLPELLARRGLVAGEVERVSPPEAYLPKENPPPETRREEER